MDGIESVYGRGALGNLTNRSRRSNGTAGPSSPLSLSLDPFVWESGYENRGGGAWVSRGTPPLDEDCEGVYEMNGASPAISPRGGSPNGGVKNIMLLAKDKEALLEEAIRLKRALHEKTFYLRRNRVHATTIQIENRKLEFDIKDMEAQGSPLDSARSPRGSSIRTKLKGLRIRYEDMRSACDAQHEEVAALRRDVRITTTQEMEMERDALLHEITRMQKDVKGLKAVQNALKCEHQELCQIKHKADELAVLNFELENCMGGVNKDLERTNQDVIIFRQKMTESSIEARKNAKQFKELEEHTEALKRLLADERSERRGLDKELAGLELQLKKAEKELTAKGLKKPASPKPKPKPREKIWEVTSPGKGGTSPRSPRKDQDGKLDTPKSKGGKPGGKGGDAAAAAAAAAASAASFKAKNASARLFGALSKTEPSPGSAALEDRAGGTFKKQASKASGTDSRQTSPESFRKKTFKEGTAAFESQETMRKKAEALEQKSLKEAEALKQKSLKDVALSKASERPQSTDALKKEASKAARPKAAEPASRSTSPSATPGKAETASAGKSKDKAADKKAEPGQGGKRRAGLKDETKGTKDEAKGTKGDALQAQKERQRLETELAAKMEKQKREMELAAKQREMELAARLEKQQKEMELAAKQREMEFLAKQRELEAAAAKQREMEAVAAAAAAKQREMELAAAAKQREMAELAAAKGLKLKAESRDEACQTSETADSYDELMRKMRKLEDELASHRSRESSPGPSSTPPPSRAFTKKLTIKVDDKQMDRKLTKKATVKKPDVAPATPGTPRKSKVASTPATPKEPERKPEPPKPEPKKPEPVPITVPVPEPEPVRKYPARQIRRQILMADQDFAEDTKQITGPADAPRPRSVMFESSSFNVLLAEPSTDPLIETQAPNE